MIKAARVLGVPVFPKDLCIYQIPKLWIERALATDRAETDAANFRMQNVIGGAFN